jgi:hypothetical protein
MNISISDAKAFRESIGATHLVVFAVSEDGQQHVATHGETERHAREAAKAGDKLKSALGWPDDLCMSTPLPRICANCTFYKPDYGTWCFNGWSGDGSRGHCLVEPGVSRVGKEHSCRHFEPK